MAAHFLFALIIGLVHAGHISVPLTLHRGDGNVQGLSRRSNVAIEPAKLANHDFWYGHFDVGNNKNLRLALDTGSPAVELDPNLYKPGPHAQNLSISGNVSYTGTMPGGCGVLEIFYEVYEDTVAVQGLTAVNQHLLNTVKHRSTGLGVETQLPAPFQGIMGLNENNQDDTYAVGGRPFFGNLCHQGQVDECRFGAAFGTSGKGEMIFGGLDTNLFNGPLRKSSLLQNQEWVIVGGVAISGSVKMRNQTFTLDTGTPNVLGPIPNVRKLFKSIGIQAVEQTIPSCGKALFGYYQCDAPPKVGFTVGGTVFEIEPSAFALQDNGNNNCTATIVGQEVADTGKNSRTLGQAWMQGKYLDFDVTSRQVGAAILKNTVNPSS